MKITTTGFSLYFEILFLGFGYMTNQLMKLAGGKVVLVLEGGYELNALAECGKSCVEALLGREVRVLLSVFG